MPIASMLNITVSILVVTSLTGTVCHHVIYNEAVTDIACGQNKWSWLMESLICVIYFGELASGIWKSRKWK